uniref:Uncharacterized protein n=1 Tax=Plectus sambesii TaxID=2011161 RepID=A0A914WJL2_9BILA
MSTEDDPRPAPLPAAEADMLVRLFQEQQQQTTRQFQLLAEKIGAAAKRPREPSPVRSDKCRPGNWHHRFNVRCIRLIQSLIDCDELVTVCSRLEDVQRLLRQRNFDLDQNDAFLGYLSFKEEQAKLDEQKEEGIDDTHLVAYKKRRAAAGLSTVRQSREGKPFLHRGAGGSRGPSAARGLPLAQQAVFGLPPAAAYVAAGAAAQPPASSSPPPPRWGALVSLHRLPPLDPPVLPTCPDSSRTPASSSRPRVSTASSSDISSASAPTSSSRPTDRPAPLRPPSELRDRFAQLFEASKGTVDFRKLVKGSLRRALSFWETLIPNSWILSVIAEGYRLPLAQNVQVPALFLRNSGSTELYKSFVEAEIATLVGSGAVREVACRPHVVSPLMVATNAVKPRLILDLSVFNTYLEHTTVKYEALDAV